MASRRRQTRKTRTLRERELERSAGRARQISAGQLQGSCRATAAIVGKSACVQPLAANHRKQQSLVSSHCQRQFVAVTNAYLDHAGPPTAPAAVQFERAVAEEELGSPVIEEQQAPPTMAEERENAFSEGAEAETGVVLERAVDQGKLLTNETLRDWVKRWCDGEREGLPHISTWNTSRVTDMSCLFFKQRRFNDDISAWCTSHVTTMKWMFAHA